MGFLGSGDKKTTSTDQRLGVSDSGQAAAHGGFIFNGGGSKKAAPANYWPLIGSAAAIAIVVWIVAKEK